MKRRRLLNIWIIVEGIFLLFVIAAVVLFGFSGGWTGMAFGKSEAGAEQASRTDEAIQTEDQKNTQSVSSAEFELPVDLTGNEYELNETVWVGSTYSMDYPEEILSKLAELTTEQKLCAVFLTTPEALTGVSRVTTAGGVLKKALEEKPVAGLFFSSGNFTSESEGMRLLKGIRGYSRELSEYSLFLGLSEQKDAGPAEMSDRGLNLFCLGIEEAKDSEVWQEAAGQLMFVMYEGDYEEAKRIREEDSDALILLSTDDIEEITESIDNGDRFLYRCEDLGTIESGLLEKAESGELLAEALDMAAANALSLRAALTEFRPEEFEKEPVVPTAAPQAPRQTTPSTPQVPGFTFPGTELVLPVIPELPQQAPTGTVQQTIPQVPAETPVLPELSGQTGQTLPTQE
ncbi:MAG: hypothetical protein IJT16_05815 [Lachnospiraceae bacterium]|nr:hypothetical protein [Lachnospiraceae bacterium]